MAWFILEWRGKSNPPPPHVRLSHVDRVYGGQSLSPEQLQRLLPRDVLQLGLHLGLVLLVHRHRLFEDRSRLSDRGNQVVFRVASLEIKKLFTLSENNGLPVLWALGSFFFLDVWLWFLFPISDCPWWGWPPVPFLYGWYKLILNHRILFLENTKSSEIEVNKSFT